MRLTKLICAAIMFLLAGQVYCAGIVDEGEVRVMDAYNDTYSFGASAKSGWEILSSSASGGSGGTWVASPPATNEDGSKNYPCGSVSATGTRIIDKSTILMFSATLSGGIRPTGSGGPPQTYSYSVSAEWRDDQLFLDPAKDVVPFGGNGGFTLRWDRVGPLNTPAYGGTVYWTCLPEVQTEWKTSRAAPEKAGAYTVQASPHSDKGDAKASELRVVKVSSITATVNPIQGETEIMGSATSSTNGIKRDEKEKPILDADEKEQAEEIPVLYTLAKPGKTVTITATPEPADEWPPDTGTGENKKSYPLWSGCGGTVSDRAYTINASTPGMYEVTASCGNSRKIKVAVIALKIKQGTEDITDQIKETIVGKKISLTGEVIPAGLNVKTKLWAVAGKHVKNYEATTEKTIITKLEGDDLKKDNVAFYWHEAGGHNVNYTVTAEIETSQPQIITVSAKTTFNLLKPSSTLMTETTSVNVYTETIYNNADGILKFGTMLNGITFEKAVTLPPNWTGQTEFWQRINSTTRRNQNKETDIWETESGTNLLDVNPANPQVAFPYPYDSPSQALLKTDKTASVDDNFTLWLMFKPEGEDSIWVPLRSVDWYWKGVAERLSSTGYRRWALKDGSADFSQTPKSTDSSTLPEWEGNSSIMYK